MDAEGDRVLITGGAGVLGRQLAPLLAAAGHAVRITSRNAEPAPQQRPAELALVQWATADLASGAGMEAALDGVATVVHAASSPFANTYDVDVEGTGRLIDLAHAARVAHLVYVSIVGIEQIPFAYYRHKLAAETLVAAGPVPWTIQRATQFHELVDILLQRLVRVPWLLPVPFGFRFQNIAALDVANVVVRDVASGPQKRAPDIGGPQVRQMRELAQLWLTARGLRRPLVPLPVFGALARGFRSGLNTTPHAVADGVTWEQWLETRYAR